MVLFKKLLFFFLMGAASLQAASLFSELSKKDQETWLKLLHYDGGESHIDEMSFFLAVDGHQNPEAEFLATIEALKDRQAPKVGKLKIAAHCAYPARTHFLKRLGFVKGEFSICPDFKLWQDEVNPEKVSVVFSTAYPNNPGSMFGHTFLKFHHKNQKNDLLNYGANYSALTNESDIGIVYAFKGIFGGYRGYFDLAPYYLKVNEYNHSENRDLIEYQLNLKEEQVHFLLMHLWELYQGASFDYFFTGENCSYHLAKLIDLVLEKPLALPKSWIYLPADLIHAIYPDLVVKIVDRPSKIREVAKVLGAVENQERIKRLYKRGRVSAREVKILSIEELRALTELLNLEKFREKEKFTKNKMLHRILENISKRRESTTSHKGEEGIAPFRNRPHLAHPTQKVSIGPGAFRKEGSLSLAYQGGYHDLLTRDLGLESFSEFKFLSAKANYLFESKKMRLQNLTMIKVSSFHPWSWFSNQLSWQAGAWVEDILEQVDCRNCYRGVVQGKLGLSFGNDVWLTSFLLGGREEVSGQLRENFNHLLVYEFLNAANISDRVKFLLSVEGRHDFANIKSIMNTMVKAGLNYSFNRHWETRLSFRQIFLGNEYKAGAYQSNLMLGYYF